ncbi:MAG: YoaK family protein [Novosphingobium sp.]
MILNDRQRRTFAMALAAMAGFVDSVGFLSAHGYFVSFMSGNTTRLGVALGTSPADALVPALLILGFVVGVTAGALVSQCAGALRKPAVLALVTTLLLAASLARAFDHHAMMMGCLVLAMGALNNTFQRDGEVTVGLTYMTGALVKLGIGLAGQLSGQRNRSWTSWAQLWTGLLAGAVLGALLQDRLPLACLWIATAWGAMMVAIAFKVPSES